ncbi:DNA mismatch repair [Rhizoctonia solani]|uniref:DNA mismatch repair n=1 Tax=Rhizoctonia solani TaxID=456999 RepID=A0A8H7IMB4_9AGAM|nr:DNA mismatch repair [Rhizoctonia solani]
MPPKQSKSSEGPKQKTLFSFINKTPNNAAATPKKSLSQFRSPVKPVASSPVGGASSEGDANMSSPVERALKTLSSAQNSSPNTNVTVDLSQDDSDDEAPVRMSTRKAVKRKAQVQDSGSEEDEAAVASFSQRIAKHAAPKGKTPAKKRRTSVSSRDDDDFIVDDDEDDEVEEIAPSKAGSEDDDDLGDDDEPPRRRKAKRSSRPPAKPTGGAPSGGSSTNFMLTAAEQRAQNNKTDKKANEGMYSFLKDPKDQKDGVRHAEEGSDPRTLWIPKGAWSSFTPFEKQFWEIKQNHFDTVLFFQKGKFYELYENDAQIGHSEFDLKLTDRVKMKMVGVPESSFQFWAAKFLAKGYKVGRVDQAETQLGAEMRQAANKGPKGKGTAAAGDKIVRRELNKVLTNGTLVDPELLQDEQAGHCISIRETEEEGEFGICVLDASTGQSFCGDYTSYESLVTEQLPLDTSEQIRRPILRSDTGRTQSIVSPELAITMAWKTTTPGRVGINDWYLRQLNIDKDILTQKNFNVYDPLQRGKGLALDGQTLSHIEVLVNSEGTEEGTLLKLLGRCVTPFGKRLFRIWICNPLQDVKAINERSDFSPEIETSFSKIVSGIPDLERIVSRVHAKSCSIKDFLKVLSAFENLSKGLATLAEMSEDFENKSVLGLLRQAPDLKKNIKRVKSFFNVEDDLLVPSSDDVDEAYCEIQTEIKQLEEKLEKKLSGLKSDLGVPKDWTKHGGTKAITRYTVPLLASTIRALKEARETRTGIVRDFKLRVFAEFDADRDVWLRAVKVTAEMDCLLSLAKASEALGSPSCRPEFVEDTGRAFVEFENLRHPALELNMKKDFIANSVRLGGQHPNVALITGPNMGGKSTVMRMTAAGVIMAQMGMLVPCESARLSPVDAILTRMGAYDSVFTNSSTFKVELDECCKILRDATPKSLVIMDELGRGTSTYDGMAIASSVLRELATKTLPLTLFATHYSSLTDMGEKHPNIRNMTMQTVVDDEKRQLVMMYKFVEGVAPGSFGTHVANVAGVPASVVDRAEQVSRDFAEVSRKKQLEKRAAVSRIPLDLQADFAQLAKLAGGLKLTDDPVQQLESLRILKDLLAPTTPPVHQHDIDSVCQCKGKQKMLEIQPVYAKAVAAATGSTMTALTTIHPVTPFDLIKTRLQTQPTATVAPPTLFPRPPLQAKAGVSSGLASSCCRPSSLPCVRNISSLAAAYPSHASIPGHSESLVCLWDGTWRTERVKGFWDAVVKVSRSEGIAGLWKGVGHRCETIAVPASTAYMLTYDYLNHSLPVAQVAPLLTPLTASTPVSPGTPHTMKSVLDGIQKMVANDGLRTLWRGLGPTLWRDVPFSGIYWAGYESGKRIANNRGYTGVEVAFGSGALSGMVAALVTMPFDTLKTRRQAALISSAEGTTNSTVSSGMTGLIRQIIHTEGPRALFAGLTPRVAKIAPACGIMIACYEGVGKFLSPVDPDSDEVTA